MLLFASGAGKSVLVTSGSQLVAGLMDEGVTRLLLRGERVAVAQRAVCQPASSLSLQPMLQTV